MLKSLLTSLILFGSVFLLPSSPVFITESQTDAVVLTAHDWVPANDLSLPTVAQYIQEWHANMSIAQQQVIASPHKNGVFSPACFIHTGFNYTLPLIQGYSYIQVWGRWWCMIIIAYAYMYTQACAHACRPLGTGTSTEVDRKYCRTIGASSCALVLLLLHHQHARIVNICSNSKVEHCQRAARLQLLLRVLHVRSPWQACLSPFIVESIGSFW